MELWRKHISKLIPIRSAGYSLSQVEMVRIHYVFWGIDSILALKFLKIIKNEKILFDFTESMACL